MSVWATLTGWHHAPAFWLSQVRPLLEGDPQSLVPAGIHINGNSAYLMLLQFIRPHGDDGIPLETKPNKAPVCVCSLA